MTRCHSEQIYTVAESVSCLLCIVTALMGLHFPFNIPVPRGSGNFPDLLFWEDQENLYCDWSCLEMGRYRCKMSLHLGPLQ